MPHPKSRLNQTNSQKTHAYPADTPVCGDPAVKLWQECLNAGGSVVERASKALTDSLP
jgi:hypothetical protein